MEKRKICFGIGTVFLLVIFVVSLLSVRSEKLTWDMLPDYQGEDIEEYVYLTAYDDGVSVCRFVCYDDRKVSPALFNEEQFLKGVSQIVGGEEVTDNENKHEPAEWNMDRFWNSTSKSWSYYPADKEQIKELQNYLLDFDYQFALIDNNTGKYAYKLKSKRKLKILDIQYKTGE